MDDILRIFVILRTRRSGVACVYVQRLRGGRRIVKSLARHRVKIDVHNGLHKRHGTVKACAAVLLHYNDFVAGGGNIPRGILRSAFGKGRFGFRYAGNPLHG